MPCDESKSLFKNFFLYPLPYILFFLNLRYRIGGSMLVKEVFHSYVVQFSVMTDFYNDLNNDNKVVQQPSSQQVSSN